MQHDKKILFDYELYTDGGSRGNPGPSAWAYVLYKRQKDYDNLERIKEDSGYLGITNSDSAEYYGALRGLQTAKQFGVERLTLYMDSLQAVRDFSDRKTAPARDLWPIYSEVLKVINSFKYFRVTHIDRAKNTIADSLVNQELDRQG